MKQITKTSEGCDYACSFCFNGRKKFKEFKLPKITSNKVILYDSSFLSRKHIVDDIYKLGSQKVNGRVVYYELTEGIAIALHSNRFINIRFAWDGSYTKKNYYRVYDGIKMLELSGYKRKSLMCYILSNYYVSLRECLYKSKIMLHQHIQVCNCRYRRNYLDPKVYHEYWDIKEIDYFKQECRMNNQIIIYNGYDPEIRFRLSRAKSLPSLLLL